MSGQPARQRRHEATTQTAWPSWLPRPAVGPPGRRGGRTGWPLRVPKHLESTRALCGLYPWVAGLGVPQVGPMLGRDRYSRQRFCFDPWQLYRLGLLEDAGILVSGTIGSGKTSLIKSLVLRGLGFGYPFAVPADLRGEWVPVVEAIGGKVLRLGPGMPDRINALAMPPKPAGVPDDEWWLTARTHWEELIAALTRTLLPEQRELTPTEATAIETALTAASRWREVDGDVGRLQPLSLGRVVEQLRRPTDAMAEVIGMDVARLTDELRDVYLTLRRLTEGSLAGLVDDDRQDNQLGHDEPGIVIDLSRVQASDASIGLVMACSQAAMELTAAHQTVRRFIPYDEAWRLMRFPALIARINSGQRLSRKTGAATVLISHRVTDFELGGKEARSYANDLLGDCSTRVVYRQRADAIDATARLLDLTDTQAELLPQLGRGAGLWRVRESTYVIDHFIPQPSSEWDLIDSDAAMVTGRTTAAGGYIHGDNDAAYRTLAGRSDAELFADA